jgi:hypothetical protein
MKYEHSPGPGNYAIDLPYHDSLSMQAGTTGRYTLLSPEEQHDKRAPELQVNLGPAVIDTKLKGPVPSSNAMVRATTKYSQGMYFNIPNDLTVFTPSQVVPPLPEYKVQEASFLNYAAKIYGNFTLVNPSVFAISVMAKIWNDVTICVPHKWEQDYSAKIKEITDSFATRIHIVNSVRGKAYLGSSGKTLSTGDWFSLQISPFAALVSSRSVGRSSIDYVFSRGRKNVPLVFNFVETNFRSHVTALKGYSNKSDFFVLSSSPLQTIPYTGTNLIGYTLLPTSASNSTIMAAVQRYGPNALNIEANVTVPCPVFEVHGYAVNYGEEVRLAYGPPPSRALCRKVPLFLDEFKWIRALVPSRSAPPYVAYVDPAYRDLWVHTFVHKGCHSDSLFHRSFGKIINRVNSSFVDKGASYMAGVRYDDTRLLERVNTHPVVTSDVLYLDAAPLLDSGDVFIKGNTLVSYQFIPAYNVQYRDQLPTVTRDLFSALKCRPGRPQLVWLDEWESVDYFLDNGFEVQEIWPCASFNEYRVDNAGYFPVMIGWSRTYRASWRDPHATISASDSVKGAI